MLPLLVSSCGQAAGWLFTISNCVVSSDSRLIRTWLSVLLVFNNIFDKVMGVCLIRQRNLLVINLQLFNTPNSLK